MIAYIVTEGPFDTYLLSSLIPNNLLNDVGLFAAGGISAVKSFARSVVVRRQIPTVIVADADSTIPELIEYRRRDIQEIVEILAIDIPIKVVLAEPEMECVLFHDPAVLARLLGFEISNDIIKSAKLQPKKALEKLLSRSQEFPHSIDLVGALKDEDIEILRQAPVIQETIEFLQSARKLTLV